MSLFIETSLNFTCVWRLIMPQMKQSLIHTALKLFNQQGVNAVPVNHIIKAMDLSPGNFYYYFTDRNALVREILEDMISQWEQKGALSPNTLSPMGAFVALGNQLKGFLQKYTFIYRDLALLEQVDPEFKQRFHSFEALRKEEVQIMLNKLMQFGSLKPMGLDVLVFLSETLWIIALHWISFAPNPEDHKSPQSLEVQVRMLLAPYVSHSYQ